MLPSVLVVGAVFNPVLDIPLIQSLYLGNDDFFSLVYTAFYPGIHCVLTGKLIQQGVANYVTGCRPEGMVAVSTMQLE